MQNVDSALWPFGAIDITLVLCFSPADTECDTSKCLEKTSKNFLNCNGRMRLSGSSFLTKIQSLTIFGSRLKSW